MNQSRQLAAIMLAHRSFSIGGFTDIIGYTVLKSKNSAKALYLVRQSKEIQRPLVEKYNGNWMVM